MTSSNGKIQAVTDGTTTEQTESEVNAVGALRRREAKGLITLACESVNATFDLVHKIHSCVYQELDATPHDELRERLLAALTCMETADHYLRMLDEALADIPRPPMAFPDEVPF